jgi:gluconate kinase
MTVRSVTLLRPTFSAIRLAHLQDFREWITRPFRSRRRFIFSCNVLPAQRDHLIQPVMDRQVAAILIVANQFKSVSLEG